MTEAETDVEPAFWADVRGEAAWDFLTTWILLIAGILLVLEDPVWPYFGLVDGGFYLRSDVMVAQAAK